MLYFLLKWHFINSYFLVFIWFGCFYFGGEFYCVCKPVFEPNILKSLRADAVKCWLVKQNSKIALIFFSPHICLCAWTAQNIHSNHFSYAKDTDYLLTFQYFAIPLVKHRLQASACIHVCTAPEMRGHTAAAAAWISPGGGGGIGQDILLQATALCQSLWFHLCRRFKAVCTSGLWSDPQW